MSADSLNSDPDSVKRIFQVALDRAVAFRDSLPSRPPRPDILPSELNRLFDRPIPEHSEDGAAVIEQLAAAADPGLMASAGQRFFGWVIGASHPVGVAADWLTSAWGQNAGNFGASPAAAMAEKVAGRWLLEILDLPRSSSVGFVTGATMANFVCLAVARSAQYTQYDWDVEANGISGGPILHVFASDEAHATVFSALRYLGLGHERAIRVPTDDQGRMDPHALESQMAFVKGPKIIIAQAGQINTGAFDSFAPIAATARAHRAWLHIDGAFGLWARACPETRRLADDIELADSWATDGHKWLQLPYDSGFAIVRDASTHRRAMGIEASYLPQAGLIEHDPSQYAPELSRRARGFATWAMLRALGRAGIAEMVWRHCALAQRLAAKLNGIEGVEILNDVELNQIIIGFGAGQPRKTQDFLARETIEEVQRRNACFLGGGLWKGRWVMRVSIISGPLQLEDIDRLAAEIISAWLQVQSRNRARSTTSANPKEVVAFPQRRTKPSTDSLLGHRLSRELSDG